MTMTPARQMPLVRIAIADFLRRAAARHPERPALIHGERQVSYRQLNADACRFAHYLLTSDLRPGDTVAMSCGNSIDIPKAVTIVEALPMTTTGKLRKSEIRRDHERLFHNTHGSAG